MASDLQLQIPDHHKFRLGTLNAMHIKHSVAERTSLLCAEVARTRYDVFCLQEVMFEPDGSSIQLKNLAYESRLNIVASHPEADLPDGHRTGNAILSRFPVLESGRIDLRVPGAYIPNASYAVFEHDSNRTLIVVNVHFMWGGDKERERLLQGTSVDAKVKYLMEKYANRNPLAVLAGDFNSTPNTDTLRYFRGEGTGSNARYTYWTDAFDVLGYPGNEITSGRDNFWAQSTAREKGIDLVQFLPNRRIDYILTYGWQYGKPGSPISLSRTFTDTSQYGFTASDHYGLKADYWVPPVVDAVPTEV